jgi:hypothetical protein
MMWGITIAAIFLMAGFLQWDKKDKIHITYHGSDKRVRYRWVKNDAKFTVFESGLYAVLPDRCASMNYNPLVILPSQVQHLDLRFDSCIPMNPESFEYTDITPQAWLALTKERDIRDYSKANTEVSRNDKKGLLDQYQGLIILGGFGIVGYLVYMLMGKIDMLGKAVNVLQAMK